MVSTAAGDSIHMLDGAVRQTSNYTPRINICDNAGKSDLIFALAYLLNIEIWPRLNSKQNQIEAGKMKIFFKVAGRYSLFI